MNYRNRNLDALFNAVEQRKSHHHANSDCSLVLDADWYEWKPAFFYGIAHTLLHTKRRFGVRTTAGSGEPAAESGEAPPSVVRLVGWADEFYWLSYWRLTGKITKDSKHESITEAPDQLLLALLATEWAGLILETYLHRRLVANPDSDGEGFLVWNPGNEDRLELALIRRAIRRLETAENTMKKLDQFPALNGNGCLDDLWRHIYIGQARNLHLASIEKDDLTMRQHQNRGFSDCSLYLDEALKRAKREEDIGFIETLKKEISNGGDGFALSSKTESGREFGPLHILGMWIVDLLGGEDRAASHLRASFPKADLPFGADSSEFPNGETIRLIEGRLDDHRSWLKFALIQEERVGFASTLSNIQQAESVFRMRAFPNTEPPGLFGDWDLYVIRDWASYTPLVPSQDKARESSTGGGYFLRTPNAGIAIDPGYNFIENLYAAGLNIGMITDVIVTHDHYDHVASFGPLLTLLHEYFEEAESRTAKCGNINFFLSRNVLDHHARAIVDFRRYAKVEPLTDLDFRYDHAHHLGEGNIRLFTTHTEHGDPISGFGRGVGLKFTFGDNIACLGITSDSGWYPEHKAETRQPDEWSLGAEFTKGDGRQPAAMVLHVGSLKLRELRDSGFYKTHLGARGTFRTVDALEKCQLAVLGEFGEECLGHRAWFAKCITDFFREPRLNRLHFNCLPCDRKTVITARGQELYVWRKGDFTDPVPYLQVEPNLDAEKASGDIHFIRRQPK